MNFREVEQAIDDAIRDRVFPGAVLLVRQGAGFLYQRAFGLRSVLPAAEPMSDDTVFDLASLTKPLATTVAVMLAVREGKLRLDDRVSRLFPNFGVHGKTHVTFRHLLSHTSGLPAHRPYFREVVEAEKTEGRVNFLGSTAAKAFVLDKVEHERLETVPGSRTLYSDLGFLLLGAAVEQVSGLSLDRFCHERIFRPLGLRSTGFIDLSALRARRLTAMTDLIAPTEDCPWRQRVLCGEVHDDNAWAMGGVAGHAGLFSTAKDVDMLLCRLKDAWRTDGSFLPQSILQEFWRRDPTVPGSTWCLGWDTPSAEGSSAGRYFSPHSVGHLGFTGCSLWLDLEADRHVILLTNRVHPSRSNDAIREFRPRIHDQIVEALEGRKGTLA